MFLILCCCNNREELERMLLPSLRKQTEPYELVLIDAAAEGFRSAAEAYNRTLQKRLQAAEDEQMRLIFCHQDIAFDDAGFLKKLEAAMDEYPDTIVGLAGITSDRRIVSNLRYRRSRAYITRHQLHQPTEVASLDECFFALPAALWHKVRFDEQTCDHWHLYAVDLCYALRRQLGTRSLVLPLAAFHKETDGSGLYTDRHFLRAMNRMVRKYRDSFSEIQTTCYQTPTRPLAAWLHYWRIRLYNWKLGRR